MPGLCARFLYKNMKKTILISSSQGEFVVVGVYYWRCLVGSFFDVFLFEDVPAADRRVDDVYLAEVERADIYVGLLGNEYGRAKPGKIFPVEQEFQRASSSQKTRFVFIKGADDSACDARMLALVNKVGHELVRRRFNSAPELIGAV